MLINNGTYQRETLSERPIRQPLTTPTAFESAAQQGAQQGGRPGWPGVKLFFLVRVDKGGGDG